KHSSGHDRRENYNSYQRTSSPEDRYSEQERSPRDRDYFDYGRSDYEHSRRGRSYDDSMELRSRDREKRRERERERERERDMDRKRSRKSPSPGRRSPEPPVTQSSSAQDEPTAKKKKDELDPLLTRTGGAYIPPAKLRMMQEQITDKNRHVNITIGLLSRSVLQAQSASPIFTHVYAALVAIINSKFPQIGELILKRLILNFRKGYRRNDKAHEVLCLEMLTLLLERPTDDSVEVAIGFLKECGLKLTQVSPRGINAIFERLRNILHESEIDKRVQYMIEVMFAVRKDGFKDHPIILEGLDLVEEDDQFTHMLPLEDDYNPEDVLNVFKMDPNFMENEEKYKAIKKEILDEGDSDSNTDQDAGSSEEEEEEEEEEGEEDEEGQKVTIHDKTEINLVSFRRTIYLAIQSRTLQPFFEGLLPRDNPRNTRFAINFFTSIGLGGLTDELREHLKNTPKVIVAQKPEVEQKKSSPSSSSASSSSESDSSDSDSDSSDSSSESSREDSDSSSSSSHTSVSAKDVRKKGQGKTRSKEVDKLIRNQQTNNRKPEERRLEQRHQETRTERERRSEKHRDQNLRDTNWRDSVTKYPSDRGVPFERNSYSRVVNDRDQEMHIDLENKHRDSHKKRGERRDSFSEKEKHRNRNKDSENIRRKDRSKSKERNRKHSDSRSDEDRYQNGADRRWEKSNRYSEQSRESKKNQDRRRERSPAKQK
ncbi:Pre-mRNA-splicing factor CWC22 like protein, partial [Tupaia chinensis]